MNRKRKIKQMRKFINKYGTIEKEYTRPKDDCYRKGSYFALFNSEKLDMICNIGGIDKYHVYKSIVKSINDEFKRIFSYKTGTNCITWLTYGNNYEKNEEIVSRLPSDEDMLGSTLDFLETVSDLYKIDGELPKDWLESIFWKKDKVI